MLYCVQCCCCRVHFVYNQSTEYTEKNCLHFICTKLRHTICALYLCKVCSAQRIRIVDFSAHVALFVCELLGDLQTLPPAVTQSCLREMGIIRTSQVLRPTCFWKWVGASKCGLGNLASSAPALQGGGTLREL